MPRSNLASRKLSDSKAKPSGKAGKFQDAKALAVAQGVEQNNKDFSIGTTSDKRQQELSCLWSRDRRGCLVSPSLYRYIEQWPQ